MIYTVYSPIKFYDKGLRRWMSVEQHAASVSATSESEAKQKARLQIAAEDRTDEVWPNSQYAIPVAM